MRRDEFSSLTIISIPETIMSSKSMKNENKILGVSLIGIGMFLTIDTAKLYYYYNYTDINFYYMYPTYELCARFIFGLLLIPTGTLILLEKNNGFKMLFVIACGMVIYGILRFIINYEYWMEEFFMGFLYILTGLFFIRIVKKNL